VGSVSAFPLSYAVEMQWRYSGDTVEVQWEYGVQWLASISNTVRVYRCEYTHVLLPADLSTLGHRETTACVRSAKQQTQD
jgi:hypothetical protein